MTPADMAALHRACFSTPRPWQAAEFAALLQSPPVFAINSPHGFALGRVIVDEAELLTLAVAPARRRRGEGAALLRDFEAEAQARGAERAFLEVAADNSAAIVLYLSAGYARSGCRRDYYRTPQGTHRDALILTRPLAGTAEPHT